MAKAETVEYTDPNTGEVLVVSPEKANELAMAAAYDGYEEDRGAGFENQTNEDMAVPFLVIMQPGSAEVVAEDSDVKAGMIINKTTKATTPGKEGINFVPALTEHKLVEWIPRDNGGGFVGQYDIDSPLAVKVRGSQPLGTYKHPENGNDLVETFYVYGVVVPTNGDAPFPATLAFSSTHIKAYKDWTFRARSIVIAKPDGTKLTKLPLFSHVYTIRTERNEKNGNTWYTPIITFAGKDAADARLTPAADLYRAAKDLKDAILGGNVKLATDTLQQEAAVDATPKKGNTKAEDAPY